MKKCSMCLHLKENSCFNKSKQTNSGLHSRCRSCSSLSKKEWFKKNKQHAAKMTGNYYSQNKTAIIAKIVKRQAIKRKTDIQEKIKHSLRKRISVALKRGYKSGSAVKDLGCSIQEFKLYIESKFQPEMTWDNYGRGDGKWQIDHIKPLFKFDLTDLKQFKDACNYINLQPLWYKDHLIKTKEDLYGDE
jgi:hypothetical protein